MCKHIRATSLSVTRLCSPFGLELMVKLRTLLTVFTFILKAEADYKKGVAFPTRGVQQITMHCASWPIRADCLSEGGTLKKTVRLREEGHRGPIIMYSI